QKQSEHLGSAILYPHLGVFFQLSEIEMHKGLGHKIPVYLVYADKHKGGNKDKGDEQASKKAFDHVLLSHITRHLYIIFYNFIISLLTVFVNIMHIKSRGHIRGFVFYCAFSSIVSFPPVLITPR